VSRTGSASSAKLVCVIIAPLILFIITFKHLASVRIDEVHLSASTSQTGIRLNLRSGRRRRSLELAGRYSDSGRGRGPSRHYSGVAITLPMANTASKISELKLAIARAELYPRQRDARVSILA
jgi:hypothetical protein